QRLSGHPPGAQSLKAMVARRIASKAYQLAPDGPIDVKGTKLWLLHPVVQAYRDRALKMLKRDPVFRDAFRAEDLKVRQKYLGNRQKAQPGVQQLENIGKGFGADLSAPPQ